jgi:hypothetical protein
MLQWKAINSIGAIVGVAFILPNLAIAQSQTTTTQIDQPNRVSVAYVATKDLILQQFYGRLRSCLRENARDLRSVSSTRAADHQDGGIQRGKFFLSARKFQADRDHLL